MPNRLPISREIGHWFQTNRGRRFWSNLWLALYLWRHNTYFDISRFRGRPNRKRPHSLLASLSVSCKNLFHPRGSPIRPSSRNTSISEGWIPGNSLVRDEVTIWTRRQASSLYPRVSVSHNPNKDSLKHSSHVLSCRFLWHKSDFILYCSQ